MIVRSLRAELDVIYLLCYCNIENNSLVNINDDIPKVAYRKFNEGIEPHRIRIPVQLKYDILMRGFDNLYHYEHKTWSDRFLSWFDGLPFWKRNITIGVSTAVIYLVAFVIGWILISLILGV